MFRLIHQKNVPNSVFFSSSQIRLNNSTNLFRLNWFSSLTGTMSVSSFVTSKCWKSHRSSHFSFPLVDRSGWKFASSLEVTNANVPLLLVESFFWFFWLWKPPPCNWFHNLLSGFREAWHSCGFPQHLRGCISQPIFINQMGLNSASGTESSIPLISLGSIKRLTVVNPFVPSCMRLNVCVCVIYCLCTAHYIANPFDLGNAIMSNLAFCVAPFSSCYLVQLPVLATA